MLSIISSYICLYYLSSNIVSADSNLRISFLPFSSLTNQFLSTVQPNNAMNITKNYIYQLIGKNGSSFDLKTIVNEYWRTYVGYLILITIGILFIVFFTLVGWCFCCCRCCCKRCGAKPPSRTVKQTKRKRAVLDVLFFLFISMIFIGAIISMASSFILLEAFKPSNETSDKDGNLLGNMDSTVSYAISYMNYLANNIRTNGTTSISDTFEKFVSILSGSITLFIETFQKKLNLTNILNVTDQIIDGYTNLKSQAGNLSGISTLHKDQAPKFEQFLIKINQNLTNILNDPACLSYRDQCDRVRSLLPTLKIGFIYRNINYSADIYAVNLFDNFDVSELVIARNNVTQRITNIITDINSTFNDYLRNFSSSLNFTSEINKYINQSLSVKDSAVNTLNTTLDTLKNAKLGNDTVYSYFRYVFYGFMILICIVLLIVLLFYVGLLFGIIGDPNFEKASYCNKSVGSGFVMGGVAISFIFGWLIMLIVAAMFLMGGLVQTEACRYITVGSNTAYLQTMDEIIKTFISKSNFSFPLGDVQLTIPKVDYLQSLLIRCQTSTDLVSAFQIPPEYFSPVTKYIYETFVLKYLKSMIENINKYNIPNINVDSIKSSGDQIIQILEKLKNTSSISTVTELNKPVTEVANFPEFVELLRNLSTISTSHKTFSMDLNSTADDLTKNVSAMSMIQQSYLLQKMNFNTSLNNLEDLLKVLNIILVSLQGNISDARAVSASVMGASLETNSLLQVSRTIFSVLKSIGNCQGLYKTFNSAVGIVCTTFLKPFNNIWMGLGWFLLFIIPAIVVGVKLHGLYRISKVDTEAPHNNKAYQTSNIMLTARDMEMIRMERPRKI